MGDWRVLRVGELAAPGKASMSTGPFGSSISARYFRESGVPVIRGGNLSSDSLVRLSDANLVFLDPDKGAGFARSTARRGDLIFTCWGTINQIGLIDDSASYDEYVISNKQMKLTPDPSLVDAEFLYYLFSSPGMQNEILEGAIGSSIPGFNLTRLRSLRVCLPALPRQREIAEALADAESVEIGLAKTIQKKEAVKQGVMQQLLTGKTRLRGFTDEWADVRVASRSFLKARIGWQGLTAAEYRVSGTHRLVGGTEFVDGFVDWSATPFVDKWRYDQDAGIQLRVGDVLLTKDGSIGKIAYVDELPGPATLNSGIFVIRPIGDAYESRFLYFMLRSRAFEEFLSRLSAGSTIAHLYQRDLVELVLRLPATLEEQRAIADVLWDIESEIGALGVRLDKARSIRTGTMQELLSGRTRLSVENTAA
jgi:type I restriction enzyme, S subunit